MKITNASLQLTQSCLKDNIKCAVLNEISDAIQNLPSMHVLCTITVQKRATTCSDSWRHMDKHPCIDVLKHMYRQSETACFCETNICIKSYVKKK